MTAMQCAESVLGRFPQKEMQGYHDSLEFKTFAEYREALLNTYREFNGAPPPPARHMFCSAPNAEAARNHFINTHRDEEEEKGKDVPGALHGFHRRDGTKS